MTKLFTWMLSTMFAWLLPILFFCTVYAAASDVTIISVLDMFLNGSGVIASVAWLIVISVVCGYQTWPDKPKTGAPEPVYNDTDDIMNMAQIRHWQDAHRQTAEHINTVERLKRENDMLRQQVIDAERKYHELV